MPNKSDRRKLRGFRKTAKGTRMVVRDKKRKILRSALTNEVLHGVPHGTNPKKMSKLAKTHRRPSVPFGGILGTKARRRVVHEMALVAAGKKTIGDVDLPLQPYVDHLLRREAA
ncbi:MAG: 50S ribosomal protein L34e [Candidatus Diapherotrites archaeon]|nr:50S ribosomal protein L34e [Candidatus Diapherotrites archaeon]MDZ4256022.1 50S ribosomal protein L34e [archaeon]